MFRGKVDYLGDIANGGLWIMGNPGESLVVDVKVRWETESWGV